MADLRIDNHGTIFLLYPVTEAGKEWIAEHIPEDAMTWGHGPMAGVVVEHRYIGAIAEGAANDGLEVE